MEKKRRDITDDQEPKLSTKNPIDKDKVAENPHLLPYSHTVGGVVIRPMDRGRTKGCLLYTSPSPRDRTRSRMPSSA